MARHPFIAAGFVCAAALLGAACGSGRSDGEIVANVERAIADNPLFDGAQIEVAAHGGVVTLSGVVAAPVQMQQAEELARSVDGVKSVESRLGVSAPPDMLEAPPPVGAAPPPPPGETR